MGRVVVAYMIEKGLERAIFSVRIDSFETVRMCIFEFKWMKIILHILIIHILFFNSSAC